MAIPEHQVTCTHKPYQWNTKENIQIHRPRVKSTHKLILWVIHQNTPILRYNLVIQLRLPLCQLFPLNTLIQVKINLLLLHSDHTAIYLQNRPSEYMPTGEIERSRPSAITNTQLANQPQPSRYQTIQSKRNSHNIIVLGINVLGIFHFYL